VSTWNLKVAPSVTRTIDRLTHPVAVSLVDFIVEPLVNRPHSIGTPLVRELTGYRSARRGPYRVVYRVDEEDRSVNVVRIGHGTDTGRSARPRRPTQQIVVGPVDDQR
jgi:mRNA interferase RelE/StbE